MTKDILRAEAANEAAEILSTKAGKYAEREVAAWEIIHLAEWILGERCLCQPDETEDEAPAFDVRLEPMPTPSRAAVLLREQLHKKRDERENI